ncbi:MAG: slipin family protein [Planctomycetes bacterium]|nr:slipin family protein [Planctomycetota bacterium]MCW8135701.1 slipin family protein [Planctomycetota bacterium]
MLDVVKAGEHVVFDPLRRVRVHKVNTRDVYFKHADLDVISRELKLYPNLFKVLELADHQRAFVFVDGRFERLLGAGRHVLVTALRDVRVEVADMRDAVYASAEMARILHGNTLEDHADVLELNDSQRALLWVDGRFRAALKPGQYLVWKGLQKVRIETFDVSDARFTHKDLTAIVHGAGANGVMTVYPIEPGHVGLWFNDGKLAGQLAPGVHAFWTGVSKLKVVNIDLRELSFDIAGQEIMTHDKVTLRLNAVLTYRVADVVKSVSVVDDAPGALYRVAQLALRAVIGARELDVLLTEKDAVADELRAIVARKAPDFGLEVLALGIRDIILPGEMKELMNKVTEARKAAEAGLITRREETAAARMQANTAKILEGNPVLMKLRELEVLEKIAGKANLTVVLGEGGLKDRVMKLM